MIKIINYNVTNKAKQMLIQYFIKSKFTFCMYTELIRHIVILQWPDKRKYRQLQIA